MLKRILLALDSSDSGPVAVSFTIALACDGAAVRIVHINEFQIGGRGLNVETAEEAGHVVEAAVAQLRSCGIQASGHASMATCSGIADYIVAEAASWPADAIVLGSSRRHGMRRLLSHGVRNRVIRLTHLPVLTAPPPLTVSTVLDGQPGRLPRRRRRGRPISQPDSLSHPRP